MSVLIGTKVKESAIWLPRYLLQLDKLEGNISRIVVIYAISRDASFSILDHWRRNVTKHKVEIYHEPYMPPEEKHEAKLARLETEIQRILKAGDEECFLKADPDLVELPADLIPRLMADDLDIVAPMNWTENSHPKTFFDTYVFRKDGCRFHPYNPPGMNKTEPFQVDSVSTCYLAKREVELAGVYVNPYPYIPYGESLRQKGYSLWVDPRVHVTHVNLENYGIQHFPLPHPYSLAQFIDDDGIKYNGGQVGAEIYQKSIQEYLQWIKQNKPKEYNGLLTFMGSRPLITASMKVYNCAEYLPCCLKAILPFVDQIDIVYGPVRRNVHASAHEDDTEEILDQFAKKHSKIRVVKGVWENKEEIQAKLLELCNSKWIFFIDADEIYTKEDMKKIRQFCKTYQDGSVPLATAEPLHFFHDWHHIAYSLNPFSPWYHGELPHPLLIWRDIPGLHFPFHTIPMDGLGRNVVPKEPYYQKRLVKLPVKMFHFGSAINEQAYRDKTLFMNVREMEWKRQDQPKPVESDMWFTGELPVDFVLEEFKGLYPKVLRKHPMLNKRLIKITQTIPNYKFERLIKNDLSHPRF